MFSLLTQHKAWGHPKVGFLEKQVSNAINLKDPQSQGAEREQSCWSSALEQLWVGLQGREGLSSLYRRHSPSLGCPSSPSPHHTAPDAPGGLAIAGALKCHWQEFLGPQEPFGPFSLKEEFGGHFLVPVFNHQVHAAALGAMPISPGVLPGVQTLTHISLYCIFMVFPDFLPSLLVTERQLCLVKEVELHSWRQLVGPYLIKSL